MVLVGNLSGEYSIRINDQFRICFRWQKDMPKMSKSSITIEGPDEGVPLVFSPPIHPGAILREEFLVPFALSPYAIAKKIGVPRTRIERLAAERTPVTIDTALRLARLFGTTPNFWINMQAAYDLTIETEAKREELDRIEKFKAA